VTALHSLLQRAAECAPEHPLFVGPQGALSYGAADAASSALAGGLRALGVARGDRVVLSLPDRPEFLVAYHGILKAGAVVVPLSPDARRRALVRLLARCQARAVITTARNAELFGEPDPALGALRALVTLGAPCPAPRGVALAAWESLLESPPLVEPCAEQDLAAINFTSGTTAEPKGVMTSHGNHLAATRAIVQYLGLGADERVAMVLPFFYSYGTSVLHTHVAVGGTVVLAGSVAFPAAVFRCIATHGCTGLSGVPSTFAHLLRSTALREHDCSSLRYVTQAGGPMSPALTRELVAAFPTARVFVMYGQTEATPRLSYLPPEQLARKLGSVGLPIPGVALQVLDELGAEAPPGVVGELVARGPNVMLGYLDDPEATRRVLRPEGLRTGDLAYRDEEGYFYVVGRKGEMIKAGAHRVGPQEVEAVIEQIPGVAQCAVVGVPDALDGEAIVAFVVPAAGAARDATALICACHEELPRFKVPAHVRFVDDLPRTATGKVRRADLRQLFEAASAARNGSGR
jgi:acyl-CoA synthetase (AMP-forming)/AMP-acid ligase II